MRSTLTLHSNTAMDENQLVIQARAGETVGLVEYIYCERLRAMAVRLVRQFRESYGVRLDAEDVQQVGAEYIVRRLARALEPSVREPIGYLLRMARLRMLDYCEEQRCPIRVPARSQRQSVQRGQGRRVPTVASLDAPLVAGKGATLLDLLVGEVPA